MKIEIWMGDSIGLKVEWSDERFDYISVDDEILELIYELSDKLTKQKPVTEMDKARQYIVETADDKTLIEMKALFPTWAVGVTVGVGDVLVFNGELYQVIQEHRTQLDWLPVNVPALYKRIQEPSTIGAWVQPQGAHDAYQLGDKVTHNDKTWECTDGRMDEELGVKLNVWEPGVYGWEITT